MAGMEGFEPPNAGTKTRCLTTWPHPIRLCVTTQQIDFIVFVAFIQLYETVV